jgi:sec-independent protein translocase protein TatA
MVRTMNDALAFISMPGPWETLLILFVALLLFGRRLPEVARSMGKSITEFKKGLNEAQHEMQTEIQKDPSSPTTEITQPPPDKR